jgi:SMODS and SLOG-associating 2TM effector domain 1/Protein of unknown function (DUF4231)
VDVNPVGATPGAGEGAADPTAMSVAVTAPAADRQLNLVWRLHRQWSLAADKARARLDRWRLWNLSLLVFGALAGAVAAQTWLSPRAATAFAIGAAIALGLAGVIQANALNSDQTARWTLARAASEALKAEAYRYLTGVAPYTGGDPAQVLGRQLDVVQGRTEAWLVDQQGMPFDQTPLPAVHSIQEYVSERAQSQAEWHRTKSIQHVGQARALRVWQLAATVAGAVLSALAGFFPSWRLSTWTAAATTIAAAFGTHLAATQHQRIAAAYAATADQLDRLIAAFDPDAATAEQQSQFVNDVERVLAAQNQGWTDLLSPKPPAGHNSDGTKTP